MSIIDEFKAYKKEHLPEIIEVFKLTQIRLDDESGELENQVKEAEKWFGRVVFMRATAKKFVSDAKEEKIPDIQKALALMSVEKPTYKQKEKFLEAAVSEVQHFHDDLDGLVETIKQRVSLGQSLLKQYRP